MRNFFRATTKKYLDIKTKENSRNYNWVNWIRFFAIYFILKKEKKIQNLQNSFKESSKFKVQSSKFKESFKEDTIKNLIYRLI